MTWSELPLIDKAKDVQYIIYKKGKPVMFARLNKALYGTLKVTLLFYKNLTAKITSWGYEVNPDDPCVANKTMNDKQCTIMWHMDYLKISHKDEAVVHQVVEDLDAKYGTHQPLKATFGKVRDYLGMSLDSTRPGKVKLKMVVYTDKILTDLLSFYDGIAPTPASNDLFNR